MEVDSDIIFDFWFCRRVLSEESKMKLLNVDGEDECECEIVVGEKVIIRG